MKRAAGTPVLYSDPLGRVRTLTHTRRRGRGNRTVVGRIAESDVRGEVGMAFIGPAEVAVPGPGAGPTLLGSLRR